MKKTMKKILALVLTMLMLLSVAAPVFANEATAAACPEVHSKKNLDEKGITYTFISEHIPERCSDQNYNLYQCDACGKYFADDITLGTACQFETTKAPTCTATGTEKCTVCGFEQEMDKLAHNYVPDKTCGYTGEDVTWTCTACDASYVAPFAGEHKWDIKVVTEPTCSTKGVANYECTICGFEKNVEIIADATHIGHTWVFGEGQVGGCFKDGTTKANITPGYYCEDCGVAAEAGQEIVVDGKTIVNETKYTVTPVNHDIDYTKPTTETNPDCKNYGFKFYACKICSYVDVDAIEVLPALGHTFERADFDKSTLTPTITGCVADATTGVITAGKNTYAVVCGDCGETGTIVDTHTIVIGKVKAPTCKDKGYTYDYCEICNLEFNKRNETDAVASAHVWVADENEAIALGDEKLYGIELAPTCVAEGKAYTTCKICGAADTNVKLPATGHNYYDADGNLVGGVLDCLNGVMVYTCTACPAETEGHEYKVAIPGFNFNDIKFHKDYDAATGTWTGVWDYLANADCTTAGVELYICSCHPEKTITVVTAPKHDIDQTTYIPAAAATCTTPGHVGFEECTKCDYEKGDKNGVIDALGHDWDEETAIEALAPTCTEIGHYAWKKCSVCGVEEGSKDEIPALGHTITLIDDINENANNGTAWEFTCSKYAYLHYGCTVCNDATTEYWTKYVAATGHNMEVTKEPTCVLDGEKTCTNDWCDGCFAEVVPMLKHMDAEGNVIECVSEDFYCYRCQADEEGNIPEDTAKLNWRQSHYDTFVTIVQGYCTEFHYVLYVCKACEKDWMDGEIAYADHDEVNAYWETVTAATFTEPGVRALICGRSGCDYVIRTENYYRTDVELSFTFDNALVPGASIVNSGYLAVTITLGAYKQSLHSVNFSFTVDSDLVELVDFVVPADSVFYNMVFASHDVADADVINVYATVQNAVDSTTPRDVEFTGYNELVTLIFKVADDANTENTDPINDKAVASFAAGSCVVNQVNDDVITSAIAGANKDITINILGDVNNDGIRNNGKVATAIDVNAIRAYVAENGYVAEADIDKDGEITVFDFEYLAQYLVGEFDYADLCAKS